MEHDEQSATPKGSGMVGSVMGPPPDFLTRLGEDIAAAGGERSDGDELPGELGRTMFDLPNSEDGSVVVLLPRDKIDQAPSQALVRILSGDDRRYLGVVTAGPFAEPDALRGDSHMLVTVTTRGGIYIPQYHGRIGVSILGEEHGDGSLSPPRFRPLPNSRVVALDDEESAKVLRADGDIRLGLVVGHDEVAVRVPSDQKSVLPRHTAVLGTTGGGKSTTIARLVQQAQAAGMAVILLDVEGEYTFLHEPTADPKMLTGLRERGLEPGGVPTEKMALYHLVGRDSANPDHPNLKEFSLQFARLSPYAVSEILDLSDAQEQRFHKAYDVAKAVMRDLDIFPIKGNGEQERLALEIDEFERGYPRLTLALMMDIVAACMAQADKKAIEPRDRRLQGEEALKMLKARVVAAEPKHAVSWGALLGKLARFNRLKVFDRTEEQSPPLKYSDLLVSGMVSIIDLSDTGMSELSNIVIADLLRGVQEAQDASYEAYEKARREGQAATPPTRALIVIEEAHEFLSAERVEKMPILFQQVARIAKRGRKRWLGLVFVTQLPQHLPRQVFGLVNSYVLHKITDPQVVSTLQRTVSGIDESLWKQLAGLAPGQAIVSFPHLARPLLVSIDPT
ncbi:MAG TPA: ATP-binding protein, partial [Chloroflexota bacterium]|nr:ATP-binding protein [Chloroflexota bacterium]